MRTLSICALALMGCSLTSKLNLPSFETTTSNGNAPRAAHARSAPTPTYASSGNGPMALPVVQAGPAPASYTWCNKVKSDRDILERALTDDDPDRAIPAIVQNLCHPDGDAKAKRNELEARRQYWMQRLAMSESDWAADVPSWAAVPYTTRNTAFVPPEEALAWSAAGPVEQYALLSMKTGDSKAFALQAGGKMYIADAFALTQAGRVAYIEQCIHTNWDNEVNLVAWAGCQPDIDALDASKFAAELRADTAPPPYDRMVIRIAWASLGPKLVAHAAKVKKAFAKEETASKLFEIAHATHKEWSAATTTRSGVLGLLRVLDDARATGSRKALQGCGEKTWAALGAAIGKLPAKDFLDVANSKTNRPIEQTLGPILNNPDAYLAAAAYVACASPRDAVAQAFSDAFQTWSGFRGPRTATVSKLRIANIESDRRDAKLEYPEFRLPLSIDGDYRHDGEGSGTGVVESMTSSGDEMRVSFVKDVRNVDVCVTWRTSNRIWFIDNAGKIHYQQECTAREVKPNNFAPSPVTFHKRFAAGISKGTTLVVASGIVVASYPKLGVPPTAVLGAAVK